MPEQKGSATHQNDTAGNANANHASAGGISLPAAPPFTYAAAKDALKQDNEIPLTGQRVVQGVFEMDPKVPAKIKAPLSELFLEFIKVAKSIGGSTQAMIEALEADKRTDIRLCIADGENEADYGGSTAMIFETGKGEWTTFQRITAEQWRAMPRDVHIKFPLTMRYTAAMPIGGKTDMRHWYTMVHELGLHIGPLYRLVEQVRSGEAQAKPPVEAIASGEFSEKHHHDELAHGDNPEFKKLYMASQAYVQKNIKGADVRILWESHEDDDIKQFIDPLSNDYIRLFEPMQAKAKLLAKLLGEGGNWKPVGKKMLAEIPDYLKKTKVIFDAIRVLLARKTPAPPPPPPDLPPPQQPLPAPVPVMIDLSHLDLPPVVLEPNSPFGWTAENIAKIKRSLETMAANDKKFEGYIPQLQPHFKD